MAGHAQLKFVMTECSKTQIRLTGLIWWLKSFTAMYMLGLLWMWDQWFWSKVLNLSCFITKPTKWLCTQRRLRSARASAQSDQSSLCAQRVAKGPSIRTGKTLIRLGGCPGWSESSLGTQAILLFLPWCGSIFSFQAHIHHYTHIDGMEVSDFAESLESLNSIIKEYSDLERQMTNPPPTEPRLQVLSWNRNRLTQSMSPIAWQNTFGSYVVYHTYDIIHVIKFQRSIREIFLSYQGGWRKMYRTYKKILHSDQGDFKILEKSGIF